MDWPYILDVWNKKEAVPKTETANHHLRGIRQLSGSPVYYPIQL